MQLQQYQTKEEKQIRKNTPPVTHNFCNCGYVLTSADRFCPQCGKANSASNAAFAFAPEEKKEIKKQPETLSQSTAEKLLKEIDDEVATSTNVEVVLNKFEQHTLFLREKKQHQTAQEQILEHFNFIKDKQHNQQESEYLAKISQHIRTATIQSGFNFAEASSNMQQSEKQLHQLMMQRQKENEALLQLEREAIASEIAAIEAEKKRRKLEEIHRQIKMEEERKRLEKEKLLKAFTGSYRNCHNCKCGGIRHEDMLIKIVYKNGVLSGVKKYNWSPYCGFKGGLYAGCEYVALLDVKLSGNSIQLTETSRYFLNKPRDELSEDDFKHNFSGTISFDGTLITGHWFDNKGNSDGNFDYFKFK